MKTCCFIGHREIPRTKELEDAVALTVERLILDEGVRRFLFGSQSEFDALCLSVVTEAKEKYPDIRRVYVRAEYPDISESYLSLLLKKYDDTFFPEKIRNAGAARYVERNALMIDESDICVFYYKNDNLPPKKVSVPGRVHIQTSVSRRSGTLSAFLYAGEKGKMIINLSH